MKIGIDASTWNNRRGFGRFTRELLEALIIEDKKNEYLFFIDSHSKNLEDLPSNVHTIVVQTSFSPIEAASATGRRSASDLWAMSRAVWRYKIDLFFFPAVYSYFPIFNRAKIILTIHDVIADHYPELIFPNSKLKAFWKLKQNIAIWQADLILTVSEYSKCEIVKYFNLPEAQVVSISEAARTVFQVKPPSDELNAVLARFKIDQEDKFLLYVGGISPHKNLSNLISAFKFIVSNLKNPFVKLILVGDYKDDPFFSAYPMLKNQIAELDLLDKITFTGFIEDIDLAYLYNAATLVVLPSLEEGFGLPAVEAMACGTPVAASNCGSLPEVLGKAGRFFDPRAVSSIAETIEMILQNDELQSEMKRAGLNRIREFTWNKASRDLISIFDKLIKK